VADLGFSKGDFWFCKKFSPKLVEEPKRGQNQNFKTQQTQISPVAGYTSNLTHHACIIKEDS